MWEIPNVIVSALGQKVKVGCPRKLRRGDPHSSWLWTGGLLEGHFTPTKEERWAGLIWHLEITGTWEGESEPLMGWKVSILTCLGSPVAQQVLSGPVLLSPHKTGSVGDVDAGPFETVSFLELRLFGTLSRLAQAGKALKSELSSLSVRYK